MTRQLHAETFPTHGGRAVDVLCEILERRGFHRAADGRKVPEGNEYLVVEQPDRIVVSWRQDGRGARWLHRDAEGLRAHLKEPSEEELAETEKESEPAIPDAAHREQDLAGQGSRERTALERLVDTQRAAAVPAVVPPPPPSPIPESLALRAAELARAERELEVGLEAARTILAAYRIVEADLAAKAAKEE